MRKIGAPRVDGRLRRSRTVTQDGLLARRGAGERVVLVVLVVVCVTLARVRVKSPNGSLMTTL